MKLSSPLFASGFLLFLSCTLAGWKWASPSASKASSSSASAAPAAGGKLARSARRTGPPEDVTHQMDAIRQAANPTERLRATVALASSLPISEISKWLDSGWFNVRGGYELIMFNSIVQERWKAEAPDQLAQWHFKNRDFQTGDDFIDWAKKDRDGFMNFMVAHRKGQDALQALNWMAKDDPALALECYLKLNDAGLDQSARSYESSVLQAIAQSSPGLLGQALANLPPAARASAEMFVVGGRLKSSFSSTVRELWQKPDGWKLFSGNCSYDPDLGGKLLGEIKNLPDSWRDGIAAGGMSFIYRDPRKWYDADLEGSGFTAEQATKLRSSALAGMASSDPEGTFPLLQKGDLTDNERRNIIGNMFSNLARDPDKMNAYYNQLSDEDKKAAQPYISRASNPPEKQPVSKWIEDISQLDPSSNEDRQNYYSRAYRQWKQEDVDELKTSFPDLPAESKTKVAQALLANGNSSMLGNEFTGQILSYLASVPQPAADPSRPPMGQPVDYSVSNYVVSLGQDDPDAASAWLQSLPDGKAKSWGQKNLASIWAQYDPEGVNRWIQSLPENVRAGVQEAAKKGRSN